ncbi:MAG: phosphoribosylanthranilate isomerase [Terriglobales bacterium]
MTWIKICGTTNLEDALTAVEAGADALGFVFYEKSPRKIDPETAREIIAKLPANVETVGVFVNQPAETILRTAAGAGLTAAQLHGVESADPEFLGKLKRGGNLKLFLVLPSSASEGGLEWNGNQQLLSAIFFDSGTSEVPGGTGKTFDWKAAAHRIHTISEKLNVVVAGGLNSANVAHAIRILEPWGVDVASGVEARPGKKDPGKVRAFIDAVRKVEKKN